MKTNIFKSLISQKECPICSCESLSLSNIFTIHPKSKLKVTLRECISCGHWWHDPIPKQTVLNALYENGSEYVVPKNYTSSIQEENLTENEPQLFKKIYKDVALHSSKISSIKNNFNYLEIGVGSGKLFNYFEKKANISFGVEPGSWVLGNSKKNIVPSIEKLPKDINFDLIIAHDVLEHLTDPIMMLSDLKKTSNEGCIISCTFPNKDSFKAKIQKEKWHMVRPLGHLHYFSKKSIRIMFEKSEWTILEIRKCRISENTSIDLIKNFKWSEKNILYRIIKSLLIGQIILGKDQWTVTAIAKTI